MTNLAENIELQTSIELPRHWFVETLKVAMVFAPRKDVRYYLNGVCLRFKTNALAIEATDGHRLFYTEHPMTVPQNLIDTQYLLDIDSLAQLKSFKKASKDEQERICVLHVPEPDSQFMSLVDITGATYQFLTVEGRYPDVDRVMWEEPTENMFDTLNTLKQRALKDNEGKEALLDRIQRLPLVSNQIGINPLYLADLAKLKPLLGKIPRAQMAFKTHTDSILITAYNALNGGKIRVYVMPMKLLDS